MDSNSHHSWKLTNDGSEENTAHFHGNKPLAAEQCYQQWQASADVITTEPLWYLWQDHALLDNTLHPNWFLVTADSWADIPDCGRNTLRARLASANDSSVVRTHQCWNVATLQCRQDLCVQGRLLLVLAFTNIRILPNLNILSVLYANTLYVWSDYLHTHPIALAVAQLADSAEYRCQVFVVSFPARGI